MDVPSEDRGTSVDDLVKQLCGAATPGYKYVGSVDIAGFCDNPAEYEWRYIGGRELLVPSSSASTSRGDSRHIDQAYIAEANVDRWELHNVSAFEGVLRRGESNVLSRRCFYLDHETWSIVLGEAYDNTSTLVQCFIVNHILTSAKRLQGHWFLIR